MRIADPTVLAGKDSTKAFPFPTDHSPDTINVIHERAAWENASHSQSTSSSSLAFAPTPIAICGIAVRLPGGVKNATDFWSLLISGRDARTPVPDSRYNTGSSSGGQNEKEALQHEWGYFIDEDLSSLDTSFFTFSKRELEKTDPQQRQLLEVAYECLENAGESSYRGQSIGCYVGTFGEDWLRMSSMDNQQMGRHTLTGYNDLMLANRVSYDIVIKTGCSSSMIALHQACRAIQTGDCEAALVAGTNLIMTPATTDMMASEGILSADCSSKTFDAKADGFARGEAINAVYIKPLDNALRDGNTVRAVIRNTATNSGGRGGSLMAPNELSHEAMIRKVYHDCGLDPRETSFIECHGTGTLTGDRTEAMAVGRIFGERGALIGSVKPNVGHSEGASGLTSLIKAVLTLEHAIVPPNIKFDTPNPQIPFQQYNLVVPVEPVAWPAGRPKRISVNSFGIGGSNAHAIIEAHSDAMTREKEPRTPQLPSPTLLLCSASTPESLQTRIDQYQAFIRANPQCLSDMAFTLATRREHLRHRSFMMVKDALNVSVAPRTKTPPTTQRLVMVFSGQGGQWPRMGADLMESEPEFLSDIQSMDKIIQASSHAPKWSIELELRKISSESNLQKAEFAQPLCTAVQIALFNMFSRAGLHPTAVVGHSSGEIAAAYAGGHISQRLAIMTAYYRGFVTKVQDRHGGMAAIGLGAGEVAAFLCPGVVIACENSPSSTTISGDLDKIQICVAEITKHKPGTLTRLLNVDQAYHSDHMKDIADQYVSLLSTEYTKDSHPFDQSETKFFSSVHRQQTLDPGQTGPKYWSENLVSPVLFASAISQVLSTFPGCAFLEVGPHSTLLGPLRQVCVAEDIHFSYVPSMLRERNCKESLLSALGQLFQKGFAVRLERLIPPGRILTDLPTYPWNLSRGHWFESRLSKEWRTRECRRHGLLGAQMPESTALEPMWRNVLSLEDEPWLLDHQVNDNVVFPLAGYCAMAGEAVRQLSSGQTGYRLRQVRVRAAMILGNSEPTEIVTTLRPATADQSPMPELWTFTICSYTRSSWTKNCEGLVMAQKNSRLPTFDHRPLVRKIHAPTWYETMARAGMVYGPSFRGMRSISSSTTRNEACALVRSTSSTQHRARVLHPTAIDACFQVVLVARAKGLGRRFVKTRVPVFVEALSVSGFADEMQVTAIQSTHKNVFDIQCSDGEELLLQASGFELRAINQDVAIAGPDPHAAAKLQWRPHIDFVDHSLLFESPVSEPRERLLLEELMFLCLIDSAERLRDLTAHKDHFAKYRRWLHTQIDQAAGGTNLIFGNATDLLKVDKHTRSRLIEEGFSRLCKTTGENSVAIGVQRIWQNIENIFTGATDTLELLMRDEILTKIYNTVSFGHSGFIQLLSHSKPNLRILEVGAGTGGTTQTFLRDLIDTQGTPQYLRYVFTDVSAGFFPYARERFSYAPNFEFRVFDISTSPLEQGFEAESFDLILAPNVVHATPVLRETLENLRVLLRRDGQLVLTELTPVAKTPAYIFGNFPGWWLGEKDGRGSEPYVSVDRWNSELKAAGFTGADTVVTDSDYPLQYNTVIISRPAYDLSPPSPDIHLTVVCNEPSLSPAADVIEAFKDKGYAVDAAKLGEEIPPKQDVISVLELENPFMATMSEKDLENLQNFLRQQRSTRILWLTMPAQIACQKPEAAMAIGMARSIRAELDIRLSTLEIDPQDCCFTESVLKVMDYVKTSKQEGDLLPDLEFALHEGHIKVGRYHPFSIPEQPSNLTETVEAPREVLKIKKTGLIDTLSWMEMPSSQPLQPDEVEIQVLVVGLSHEDLEVALKNPSLVSEGGGFGVEAVGKVIALGTNVERLMVNDIVLALCADGCAATTTVVPTSLVAKLPEGLDIETAATMPLCFATGMHTLITKGRLERGQSVLIHYADSNTGRAAVQICRTMGAKIFVTAASEEGRRYLAETVNIPKAHIIRATSDHLEHDVMHATDNMGCDLVLNPVGEEWSHVLKKCVASFGALIDVRRQGHNEYSRGDLGQLAGNMSYYQVDMMQLIRQRPQIIGRLLSQICEGFQQGDFSPLPCDVVYEPHDVSQAFAHLQQEGALSKVLINVSSKSPVTAEEKAKRPSDLDPSASYLLTGGLGGIGKSLAVWMVERGARSLTFLSPNAGVSNEDKSFACELESLQCMVNFQQGRAENIEDVSWAVSSSKSTVKGVVHLAMVLRDASVTDMSYADWNAAVKPKVQGAWNLHNVLKDQALDFFVLVSSLLCTVEWPGQCNYNAGNAFLEGFCQFRRQHGLTASVIGVGPTDGVGFLSKNTKSQKKVRNSGLYFLQEQHLLDAFELAMQSSKSTTPAQTLTNNVDSPWKPWCSEGQFVVGLRSEKPLSDATNRIPWLRDRRMGFYHNLSTGLEPAGEPSKSDTLDAFLARASGDTETLDDATSVEFLSEAISTRLAELTLRTPADISLDASAAHSGLDSLTAIELRRWWKQALGLDVSVLELTGTASLRQLGTIAAEKLKAKLKAVE